MRDSNYPNGSWAKGEIVFEYYEFALVENSLDGRKFTEHVYEV
jgi:hypothetical protein